MYQNCNNNKVGSSTEENTMKTNMETKSLLALTCCLVVCVNCAKKSRVEHKVDILDNLFRGEMYLVNEKLETGRQEREMLLEKFNETMEYLEELGKDEGKTLPNTNTEGRQSDLDMLLDKIEVLTDEVEQNDRDTDKLSESLIHIKRGVQEEKIARKADTNAVIKQLNEVKENQNEMVSSMRNVLINQNKIINMVQENQVKVDNYLTNILSNQADLDLPSHLKDISQVQLEILNSQGDLLNTVNESTSNTEDLKQSNVKLQHKIDVLTNGVSNLDKNNQGSNLNELVQKQLTQIQERINLLIPTVQLVKGHNPYEGRVEINYEGRKGTVCDDKWDDKDAAVVCRMLGYTGGTALLGPAGRGGHTFGRGTGETLLDDVECTGNEDSLFQCKHRGIGVEDCHHGEDAGVRCDA